LTPFVTDEQTVTCLANVKPELKNTPALGGQADAIVNVPNLTIHTCFWSRLFFNAFAVTVLFYFTD